MTAKQQQDQNRLNARRSTGPRSSLGKQIASRNALRHGLSTPLDPHNPDPTFRRLVSLLEAEDIPTPAAQQLAARILDYERNLAHERRLLLDQDAQQTDEDTLRGEFPDTGLIETHLKQEMLQGRGVSRSEARETLKFIEQLKRHFQRSAARNVARERRNAPRYLRRASNQLIKALRNLA